MIKSTKDYGKFKFREDNREKIDTMDLNRLQEYIKERNLLPFRPICWDTIDYIKEMNGVSSYTSSSRFWKALVKIVDHPNFEKDKWMTNLKMLVSKFNPQASTEDYFKIMKDVYNWDNNKKIED